MSDLSTLVLATRNAGKIAELRVLLTDLPLRLVPASDVEGVPDVEEDAPTLEGNARKKALALHRHTGYAALADDTGLEVDALGGAPGVHSARYAGEEADNLRNRDRLLDELEGVEDRAAQFRTVLAYVDEEGDVHTFEGVCRGRIVEAPRGEGGFGYDAVFLPADAPAGAEGQTFAEMTAEAKNAVSHRARALTACAAFLRQHLAAASS